MIDWDLVWRDYIGIGWSGLLGVVVSTVVLYLFFSLVVHLAGPRLMATASVGSFVALAVLGGVSARATLGESPTLLGALAVLTTVLLLERLLGTVGRTTRALPARARRRPVVVMVAGEPVAEALRRHHLPRRDLVDRLRTQGLLELEEAALVILERRGALTVVRRGSRIDPRLVEDVEGMEAVPAQLLVR
ncbi:YetF domain-containing protein [Brachybacterium squillarum]|uniref:YetF domain-containing protein n=1 Tax=Brachybacterium squillarum TaxID=661979 RepID=UPI002221486F|nr:YetF domain-containing protein [Brachybacterium squillarum]MCW1803834.1 DUF421 domain-containing protein [Brachybacterium squillarum]